MGFLKKLGDAGARIGKKLLGRGRRKSTARQIAAGGMSKTAPTGTTTGGMGGPQGSHYGV